MPLSSDGSIQNTPIEIDLPVSKSLEESIPKLIAQGITTKKDLVIATKVHSLDRSRYRSHYIGVGIGVMKKELN
jgi:hypothetical protein